MKMKAHASAAPVRSKAPRPATPAEPSPAESGTRSNRALCELALREREPAAPPPMPSIGAVMQRKVVPSASAPSAPAGPAAPRAAGARLPPAVQAGMEGSFGADFSDVRVHEDASADRVGALAFTQGTDVTVAPGQYQPDTRAGRALLGHELAHVVQQRAGLVSTPQGKGGAINADPALEAEADRAGERAADGQAATVAGTAAGLQKKAMGATGPVQRLVAKDDRTGRYYDIDDPQKRLFRNESAAESHARLHRAEWARAHLRFAKQDTKSQRALTRFASRGSKLKEIVWEHHRDAIANVCKQHHYVVSIRETGALSIKRIAQGAKAKPHTILEKSIKQSSLDKAYGPTEGPKMLKRVKALDLDGFVGHWRNNQLIGVRVDGASDTFKTRTGARPILPGELYVPLDLTQDGGGDNIKRLKRQKNWKTYLYTGDYDMHEALAARGGMLGQVPEATQEKVDLLNRLNAQIAKKDKSRTGTATLGHGGHAEEGPETVHTSGSHAMFQHGDQATYIMNQHLEAAATVAQGPATEEDPTTAKVVAQLVDAVASESNEPVAWCVFGKWYVTLDAKEHQAFRAAYGFTMPSAWDKSSIDKVGSGQRYTERHVGKAGPRTRQRPIRANLDAAQAEIQQRQDEDRAESAARMYELAMGPYQSYLQQRRDEEDALPEI